MKLNLHLFYKIIKSIFFSSYTTVLCLLFLSVLVLWGTLYQIDNGIYAAKERFFNSWFILIKGIIPFPGLRIIGLLLIVNLFLMFFKRNYSVKNIGLTIGHLGIFIFLIGGAIISYTAKEMFLSLYEGNSSNMASSYTQWEIAIWTNNNTSTNKSNNITLFTDTITPGLIYSLPFLNSSIKISRYYKNCLQPFMSEFNNMQLSNYQQYQNKIEPLETSRDPSDNLPCAEIEFIKNDTVVQNISLFGAISSPTYIYFLNDTIWFLLQRKKIQLPVNITLIDFIKENYPQTQMAKQYKSIIKVVADDLNREAVISMNKPFRYKNYTFYQASFYQNKGIESSTFAIVENKGKWLPYISGAFMFLGFSIHFIIKLFTYIKKQKQEKL
jgi:hypothetical protein